MNATEFFGLKHGALIQGFEVMPPIPDNGRFAERVLTFGEHGWKIRESAMKLDAAVVDFYSDNVVAAHGFQSIKNEPGIIKLPGKIPPSLVLGKNYYSYRRLMQTSIKYKRYEFGEPVGLLLGDIIVCSNPIGFMANQITTILARVLSGVDVGWLNLSLKTTDPEWEIEVV